MDNLRFTTYGYDELDIVDRVITLDVEAVSSESSARQIWYLTALGLEDLGEAMVHHSYSPDEDRYLGCFAPMPYLGDAASAGAERTRSLGVFLHKAKSSGRLPIEISFELQDSVVGWYPVTVVVWTELGQLERFGRRVAALADRKKGFFCDLNPKEI